jgi:hypothetical protein
MNRAFLVVGIPGIIVVVAYCAIFYGRRPALIAGFVGAILIGVSLWDMWRRRKAAGS